MTGTSGDFLVYDGANFPGPRVGREVPSLVTEFVGQAHSHWPVPGLGHADPRPDMIAYALPPSIGLDTGKHVEPGLKPAGETLAEFQGLVLRMVAGEDAVLRDLAAVGREVRMQLHHRASGRNCIGAVYLDLVVVLGMSQSSQQYDYKNC